MSELIVRGKFKSTVDRSAIARGWKARGFSCELFVDPPGREWLDFRHETNELIAVVEGRLHLTVGDQAFVAEVGDEVFIPRRALHSVRNIHDQTTRWLYGYD
jgi:mannose-6-phosphate isomerase-like protein (cupin superfamily)